MIKYDEYGLIVQHRPDEPDYAYGGDSCMKTSIAVIGGLTSALKLDAFVNSNYEVLRHPFISPYNKTSETSRDQLIPLLAAARLSKRPYFASVISDNYKYRINKDLLISPSIQWFMRKCAGDDSYSWLGDKMIRLDIWYASKRDPDHELNQLFCMCLVLGKQYVQLLCKSHPDWRKNIRDYWGTETKFRFQPEIGEAFIQRIEQEL